MESAGYPTQAAAAAQEWGDLAAQARLARILQLCFPAYDPFALASPPVRHPIRAWWWRGATVTALVEEPDGCLRVTLSSDVGLGEVDELSDFIVPGVWLELEDPTEVVLTYCQEATAYRREQLHKLLQLEANPLAVGTPA